MINVIFLQQFDRRQASQQRSLIKESGLLKSMGNCIEQQTLWESNGV